MAKNSFYYRRHNLLGWQTQHSNTNTTASFLDQNMCMSIADELSEHSTICTFLSTYPVFSEGPFFWLFA